MKEKLKERDISKRWTPKLVESGWTPVSDYFLEHYADLPTPITSSEAMLIIQLIAFKWDDDAPYPGFKTLAKRMGMTDTQVRNHARSLERKQLIQREMRIGQTNKFDLTPLFKVLEQDRQIKIDDGKVQRSR